MASAKPNSIDDYLAGLNEQPRAALQRVRQSIREAVPEAEEGFSYGMPAFRLKGRPRTTPCLRS